MSMAQFNIARSAARYAFLLIYRGAAHNALRRRDSQIPTRHAPENSSIVWSEFSSASLAGDLPGPCSISVSTKWGGALLGAKSLHGCLVGGKYSSARMALRLNLSDEARLPLRWPELVMKSLWKPRKYDCSEMCYRSGMDFYSRVFVPILDCCFNSKRAAKVACDQLILVASKRLCCNRNSRLIPRSIVADKTCNGNWVLHLLDIFWQYTLSATDIENLAEFCKPGQRDRVESCSVVKFSVSLIKAFTVLYRSRDRIKPIVPLGEPVKLLYGMIAREVFVVALILMRYRGVSREASYTNLLLKVVWFYGVCLSTHLWYPQ